VQLASRGKQRQWVSSERFPLGGLKAAFISLKLCAGYWFLHKKCPCTVPTGLRNELAQSLFPHASTPRNKRRFLGTPVKRGANQRCASGAPDRTLLMQSSIKLVPFKLTTRVELP
jgi:hypothetical protein